MEKNIKDGACSARLVTNLEWLEGETSSAQK